jgi:hypothetical protein
LSLLNRGWVLAFAHVRWVCLWLSHFTYASVSHLLLQLFVLVRSAWHVHSSGWTLSLFLASCWDQILYI